MPRTRIIKSIGLLVGLSVCLSAGALQTRTASDNQTISIKIAKNELTRIFVEGDRINSLTGSANYYFHKENTETGDLYVQPIPEHGNESFNIFIGTEQGRHYNLFITPADVPADFIEIKPKNSVSVSQTTWEKDTPYTRMLLSLIKAMAQGKALTDYEVVASKKPTSISGFRHKISVQMAETYFGKELRGEILIITNKTRRPLFLTETQFYQKGTRALSLKDHEIFPHSKTLLFRVMNNHVS